MHSLKGFFARPFIRYAFWLNHNPKNSIFFAHSLIFWLPGHTQGTTFPIFILFEMTENKDENNHNNKVYRIKE